MVLKVTVFLSVLMLTYLWAPMVFTSDIQKPYPISLLVYNSLTNQKNLTFTTDIAYRGILLGAMRKVQAANTDFKVNMANNQLLGNSGTKMGFTVREDPNYGPFLESVNGVAGCDAERTYWELLVKLQNGTMIRPDVGVGCYIPNPHDTVILKFTTW